MVGHQGWEGTRVAGYKHESSQGQEGARVGGHKGKRVQEWDKGR